MNTPIRDQSLEKEQLWDEIGFHKLLGGFWYNLTYAIIGIILSSTFAGILMGMFYPFPESLGYKDMVWATFSTMFVAFDLGTGYVMDRFIAKENISDPGMMVKYIQYFIWYQGITGLIQITSISFYALFIVPESNRAYAVYLMLIAGSTQYPGFLGVFSNVLDSLQHYNKTRLLNFLSGTIVQRFTEMGFAYAGGQIGRHVPEIGQLMGIAIGGIFGLYIDDFVAMLISARFFSNALKPYGIRARDCLRPDFTYHEIKDAMWYGIKTGAPGFIGSFLGFVNFTLWLTHMPQYTTYISLAMIGGSIPGIIGTFTTPRITPLISESYNNGKNGLTQYFIGQYIRFYAQIHGFFVPLLVVFSLVFHIIFIEIGMDNYVPAIMFIIPTLVVNVMNSYLGVPGQVLYAANKPNFPIVVGLIGSVLNTLLVYLILVKSTVLIDVPALIPWIYKCYGLLIGVPIAILMYRYMHNNVIKLKIPLKQIIYGFIVSSIVTLFVCYLLKLFVFDTLYSKVGFYPALILSIIVISLSVFVVYFPLSAYLGGWDDQNLSEFHKAMIMSGPSKILVKFIYTLVYKSSMKSSLHNKFAPNMEKIEQEASELLLQKKVNRESYRNNQS